MSVARNAKAVTPTPIPTQIPTLDATPDASTNDIGEPSEINETSKTAFNNTSAKLIDKVMERIDLDDLSNTLADQLASQLADSIKIESLVATLFTEYGEGLQDQLTNRILRRL